MREREIESEKMREEDKKRKKTVGWREREGKREGERESETVSDRAPLVNIPHIPFSLFSLAFSLITR